MFTFRVSRLQTHAQTDVHSSPVLLQRSCRPTSSWNQEVLAVTRKNLALPSTLKLNVGFGFLESDNQTFTV